MLVAGTVSFELQRHLRHPNLAVHVVAYGNGGLLERGGLLSGLLESVRDGLESLKLIERHIVGGRFGHCGPVERAARDVGLGVHRVVDEGVALVVCVALHAARVEKRGR